MYAIIRAGGKQAKVQSGDVIEIERVKGDADELSFLTASRGGRQGQRGVRS